MSDQGNAGTEGDPPATDAGGDLGSAQGGDLGASAPPGGPGAPLSTEEARQALGGENPEGGTMGDPLDPDDLPPWKQAP